MNWRHRSSSSSSTLAPSSRSSPRESDGGSVLPGLPPGPTRFFPPAVVLQFSCCLFKSSKDVLDKELKISLIVVWLSTIVTSQ